MDAGLRGYRKARHYQGSDALKNGVAAQQADNVSSCPGESQRYSFGED